MIDEMAKEKQSLKEIAENKEKVMSDEYAKGYIDARMDSCLRVVGNPNLILEDANETLAMFYSEEMALKDRKTFVKNLGKLASQTRDGVAGMVLDDDENVIIYFKRGGEHRVNVRMDSYAAIIRDVAKHIT
jgi:hypothetical protein